MFVKLQRKLNSPPAQGFDNNYELLHDRLDLNAVNPLTEKEYFVGGSTALLDAVGLTINKISKAQANSKPEYRAEKVLFVITTDGEENASREYNLDQIKCLIEKHKEKHGWEFIFLGANIDTVDVAHGFGIDAAHASNFRADALGIGTAFASVSYAATGLRKGQSVAKDWKKYVQKDFLARKK